MSERRLQAPAAEPGHAPEEPRRLGRTFGDERRNAGAKPALPVFHADQNRHVPPHATNGNPEH